MADINVTINPAPSVSAQVSAAPEVDVTIGEGIPKHAVTHAPGGSDSLEAYYATTGSLAYVSGLTTGIGSTGYLTGYVSKSETGDFYPSSNPSGFITGVDLSGYVTGDVVRPSQTGDFVTNSQTGNFITSSQTGQFVSDSETGAFYPASNPSGFITGVDLSNYVTGSVVRPSETGDFITSSQTGQFVADSETGAFYPASNPSGFITGVDLSAYVTGDVVRPSQTGAFLTTGAADTRYALQSQTGNFVTTSQTGQFVGDSETGAFYPASNPSGFITGVDLSNYVTGDVVRPSETGNFVTTSETGNFVTTSQTGQFYPVSNPSGYITGVDLSGYVTGDVVRPSETGDFITESQTGAFYPSSNPSGFITGVDLSSYATTVYVTGVSGHLQNQINNLNNATGSYVTGDVVRPSETGSFITTGQTGQFVGDSETGIFYPASNPSGFITGVDLSAYVTGDVVRPSETGAFLTTGAGDNRYALQSNTGVFVTTGQTGNFVTGSVVRPSETGDFITQSQTGQFYAASNPSGFITGVDLSSYATTSYVTGISGNLQNKIDIASGYAVTGYNDSITGIEVTGNLTKTINLFQRDGGVLSASFSDVSGSGGALIENVVYTTGNQDISGLKDFQTRPTVLDIPVLVSGDPVDLIHLYAKNDQGSTIYKGQPVYINSANGTNPLMQLASNTGERTSSKTIGLLAQDLLVNEFGYVITEGVLEGFDTSSASAGDPMWLGTTGDIIYGTGNKPYGNNHLVYLGVVLRAQSNNGKVYVKVQNGFEIDELHRVYAKNPEDFSTLIYNSGSGSWFARQMTTGDVSGINNYVLKSETGSFITTSQTGQFVGDNETGAFLTTGAADGRYALQSQTGDFITTAQTGQFVGDSETGNFITTSQTGAFYPASNPSGFITGVDLSAYVTGDVVRPSETGAFLTTGAADSRYALQSATGNFITTSQTGAFAAAANTGAFLTTGAADSRYYSLANGQSISGYAITGYNDAITGMSVTGDSTKTITLFQRDGTTVSANFTDNSGSGGGGSVSNVVFLTGNQIISGEKTFTGKLIAATGFFGISNSYGNFNNQTIAGGTLNTVSGDSAVVAGGGGNQAIDSASVVVGGSSNQAIGYASAVVGGGSNLSSGSYSFIGGGDSNSINNSYSVIAGGRFNIANGERAFVGGGFGNDALGNYSVVGGGFFNEASGENSTVAGGTSNVATGYAASIIGGQSNIASASYSTALGYGAKADRYGAKAFSSDYFVDQGDSQNISFVLNGKSTNGSIVALSLDGNGANFNLLEAQTNKIVLATIKVIGVDEDANISQYMRKIVFSTLSSNTGQQRIHHLESIGTDMENAGTIFFSATGSLNTGSYQNVFCMFGSGLSSQATHWVAHVDAVETVLPSAYP